MQPLISVDHESRHNNSSRNEDVHETVETENTPLIRRFPLGNNTTNPSTKMLVTFLIILLITGAIIGIYLLIIQHNSENVLPPVDTPLQLVSRIQWDHSKSSSLVLLKLPIYRQKQVVVVQTGTDQCFSLDSCTALLQEMQVNATASNSILPYNFLISSNGQTYEALGWYKTPFTQSISGLVLAFIGDFDQVSPTQVQLVEAKNFFDESVSQQHLDPSYTIVGKSIGNGTSAYLFRSLKIFPQWNNTLSEAS